jgi:NAD(P)H-hydrate repair Nnr-like enzyme with NAD(P)H-hydrate dehydratase domain
MVVTGFSGAQAVTTGAYDPNAAGNNSITLTPIAGATTAMAGTGDLLATSACSA